MPYVIKAWCPCCKKEADGYDGIRETFGWRIVSGKKIPQAYCKKCRTGKCKPSKCKAK
jgi:hypothetical protein